MQNSGFNKSALSSSNQQNQKPNLEFQYLQQNNKKHSILVVLLIIFLIIILGIICVIAYDFFQKNKQANLTADLYNQDIDGDGLTTIEELKYGTDQNQYDTDFDKMPDGWETRNNLDPKDYLDAVKDNDEDGLTNLQELQYNSNPNIKDTDNDGFNDGDEVKNNYNPNGEGKIIK
ncbi:MAG: hypothetical protein PHN19_03335 [Patescibacteria group bacterium]|nr:hypothetical protein [Patescibacteria group bacterium]